MASDIHNLCTLKRYKGNYNHTMWLPVNMIIQWAEFTRIIHEWILPKQEFDPLLMSITCIHKYHPAPSNSWDLLLSPTYPSIVGALALPPFVGGTFLAPARKLCSEQACVHGACATLVIISWYIFWID